MVWNLEGVVLFGSWEEWQQPYSCHRIMIKRMGASNPTLCVGLITIG